MADSASLKRISLYIFLCAIPIILVIVLFGLSVYKHYQSRADQGNAVFDVQLNPSYQVELNPIPTMFWNTYFSPKKHTELLLRDFWIASSYRSYQPCGGTNDVTSYKTIQNVLEKGARAIHLDVWSSTPDDLFDPSSEPIVRNKGLMGFVGKALDLEECCRIIANQAWNGNKFPLLLYLEFHEPAAKNKYLLAKVSKILYQYFSPRLLPPQYGFSRIPVGTIPIRLAMGKIIFLTNEYPLQSSLNELINGTISNTNKQTCMIFEFSKEHADFGGIQSTENNTQDLIDFNQIHLSMVIPQHEDNPKNSIAPKIDLHNPDPEDCWQHGFHMVFMNYQLYDDNMKKYVEMFKNAPFVIRVDNDPKDTDKLRYIEKPKVKPIQQNTEASYAPRPFSSHGDFFQHTI